MKVYVVWICKDSNDLKKFIIDSIWDCKADAENRCKELIVDENVVTADYLVETVRKGKISNVKSFVDEMIENDLQIWILIVSIELLIFNLQLFSYYLTHFI